MSINASATIASDDTAWIAAKKAASIAHSELNHLVISLPYDQLSPSLLEARIAFDNAQSHLRHVQSRRSIALYGERGSDHHAQPARLSGSAT